MKVENEKSLSASSSRLLNKSKVLEKKFATTNSYAQLEEQNQRHGGNSSTPDFQKM